MSIFSLSDSELSLSDSEISKELIEDQACRESIRLLLGNIEEKQAGIKNSKFQIKDLDKEIKDANETIKNLENLIKAKSEDYGASQMQENILKSKLKDLDAEIDELFIFSDKELYTNRMHKMKKELMETSGLCGVYKKKIDNLKEQFKEKDILVNIKDKEFKAIHEELMCLKSAKNRKNSIENERFLGPTNRVSLSFTNENNLSSNIFDEIKQKLKENILSPEVKKFEDLLKHSLKEIE